MAVYVRVVEELADQLQRRRRMDRAAEGLDIRQVVRHQQAEVRRWVEELRRPVERNINF